MAKPRSLDPANLPLKPSPIEEPERLAARVSEFQAYLRVVAQNYRAAKEHLGSDTDFNRSLTRLGASVRRKRRFREVRGRLHPDIEIVISRRARTLARRRGGRLGQQDVDEAARYVATHMRARRGRPSARNLEFHLTCIIALVQEISGLPVTAHRERAGRYDPHFPDGISQLIPTIFAQIDPDVSLTSLVEKTIKIRKRYAGKDLRFGDLMPFRPVTINGRTEMVLSIEQFEPNIPIYSR